jgi:hypothetical protein
MFCYVISFDEKLFNEQLGNRRETANIRQHKGEHKFRRGRRQLFAHVNRRIPKCLSSTIVTLFKDGAPPSENFARPFMCS